MNDNLLFQDLLDMISYKGPVHFDALFKRHYDHAARFFGLMMLKRLDVVTVFLADRIYSISAVLRVLNPCESYA